MALDTVNKLNKPLIFKKIYTILKKQFILMCKWILESWNIFPEVLIMFTEPCILNVLNRITNDMCFKIEAQHHHQFSNLKNVALYYSCGQI